MELLCRGKKSFGFAENRGFGYAEAFGFHRARPGAGCVQGAINRAPTLIPIAMTVRRQQCLLATMVYLHETSRGE